MNPRLFLAAAFLSSTSLAQILPDTAKTSTGTITEFSPEVILIRTQTAPQPLRFVHRKSTVYHDSAGKILAPEAMKPGLPVTIYHVQEGTDQVASKIVLTLERPVPLSTFEFPGLPPKRTRGEVTEANSKNLLIRYPGSLDPVRFVLRDKTVFQDDKGTVVAAESARTGRSVTIEYDRQGDSLFAEKVTVHATQTTPQSLKSP